MLVSGVDTGRLRVDESGSRSEECDGEESSATGSVCQTRVVTGYTGGDVYFGWPPSNRIHSNGCVRALSRVRWCVTGNARMIEGMGIIDGQSELELIGLGLAGGDRLWDRAFVNVPAVLVAFLKRLGTRGFREIRAWTTFNRTNDMDI